MSTRRSRARQVDGDEALIAFALDQQQDRLAMRRLRLVHGAGDVRGAGDRLLVDAGDHVAWLQSLLRRVRALIDGGHQCSARVLRQAVTRPRAAVDRRQGQAQRAEFDATRMRLGGPFGPFFGRGDLTRHLADADVERDLAVVAPDGQGRLRVDGRVGDRAAQLPRRRHRRSVEGEDDVALTNAGLHRRTAVRDGGDQRAFRLVQGEALRDLRGDRLDGDAEPAALHRALLLQLGHDLLRDVRRNGEADADAASVGGEYRGIDADDLPAPLNSGPPELPPL